MSESISDRMEQILDRFDDAWNGPTPPRIEDYLTEAAPDQRLPLLIELVRIDLERRLAAGEKARLDETYLRRFPELFAEPPALVTLVKHEYELRRRNEPELMPAEYLERFPQCQTELVAQLPTLDEIPSQERQPKTADAPEGLDPRGYELIETLGKGGMGEVYRCVDPSLGRDLAIKVMMAAHRGHPERERRFLREARVTGSLQHPGIVPIHNLGRLRDGRLHYTMRLVRGQTFAHILKEQAGKPEHLPYLLSIFEKICQAVAYAHSKRVIHRDLKPQNVMVGKFGEAQVMDWGLAKMLTTDDAAADAEELAEVVGTRIFTESADTPVDLSRVGVGLGTLQYMPSEQARGKWNLVDERADVFALGSILCEILTGQPAYIGASSSELIDRAERGDVTETVQRLQRCGANTALTSLCRECLSPQREDRPRDAAELAKRVGEYQAEVQERLRRAEVERAEAQLRAREERKQRRLLIALVLALLVGGGLITWQAVRATQAEKKALAERDDKENALVKAEAAAEAERQAKEAEALQRKQAEDQKMRAEASERKAKESEADTKAVLNFFQNKVLSAGRPKGQGGGLGKDVTLRQAVDQAENDIAGSFKDRPLVEASIRNTLGTTYWYLGDYAQAIQQHERASGVRESKLGPDHPDTHVSQHDLASAYLSAGRTAKAIRLYEQNLKQQEAKLGTDHPHTLVSRGSLAAAYSSAGRTTEALRLHEQNLKLQEAKLGPDNPHTLTARSNLAAAYLAAGRTSEALRLFEQTLKRVEDMFGPDHLDTIIPRNNLADAYVTHAGRPEEAIPLHERNLKLCESNLGTDHPKTLTCRHNLALAFSSAGRTVEATRLYEQTLKQQERKLGRDHPDTLASRLCLAAEYKSDGRISEAISLYEPNLKLCESKLGTDHPTTLISRNHLAVTYQAAGRTAEAIPLLEQTVKQSEAKLGIDHPYTLVFRDCLASAYVSADRSADAIRLYEQTLKQQQDKNGPDHPNTLQTMVGLGGAYRGAGRLKDAIPLFEEAFERGRKRSGGFTARLGGLPGTLAGAYEQSGQFTKAEAIYRDSLEQARRKYGPEDPRTAGQLALLGSNLMLQRKYTDAEPLLRDCLKVREAKQPDDWATFNARSLLGAARLGQKKYTEAEPLLLQGYEGMKTRQAKIPPQGKIHLSAALERLVQLYEATEQKDKAAVWREKMQETKATQRKPKP